MPIFIPLTEEVPPQLPTNSSFTVTIPSGKWGAKLAIVTTKSDPNTSIGIACVQAPPPTALVYGLIEKGDVILSINGEKVAGAKVSEVKNKMMEWKTTQTTTCSGIHHIQKQKQKQSNINSTTTNITIVVRRKLNMVDKDNHHHNHHQDNDNDDHDNNETKTRKRGSSIPSTIRTTLNVALQDGDDPGISDAHSSVTDSNVTFSLHPKYNNNNNNNSMNQDHQTAAQNNNNITTSTTAMAKPLQDDHQLSPENPEEEKQLQATKKQTQLVNNREEKGDKNNNNDDEHDDSDTPLHTTKTGGRGDDDAINSNDKRDEEITQKPRITALSSSSSGDDADDDDSFFRKCQRMRQRYQWMMSNINDADSLTSNSIDNADGEDVSLLSGQPPVVQIVRPRRPSRPKKKKKKRTKRKRKERQGTHLGETNDNGIDRASSSSSDSSNDNARNDDSSSSDSSSDNGEDSSLLLASDKSARATKIKPGAPIPPPALTSRNFKSVNYNEDRKNHHRNGLSMDHDGNSNNTSSSSSSDHLVAYNPAPIAKRRRKKQPPPPPASKSKRKRACTDGAANEAKLVLLDNEAGKVQNPLILVSERDRSRIPEYLFLLMSQFIRLPLNKPAAARISSSSGRSNAMTIICRHCQNARNPFRYTTSSLRAFGSRFKTTHDHIRRCKPCPMLIKNNLMDLELSQARQWVKCKPDAESKFYERVWKRLNQPLAEAAGAAGASAAGAGWSDDLYSSSSESDAGESTSEAEFM